MNITNVIVLSTVLTTNTVIRHVEIVPAPVVNGMSDAILHYRTVMESTNVIRTTELGYKSGTNIISIGIISCEEKR